MITSMRRKEISPVSPMCQTTEKNFLFSDPDRCMAEGMLMVERETSLKWHVSEKETCASLFDFRKPTTEYCASDVADMRKCAQGCCDVFETSTKLDHFKSVRLAAACQKYFEILVEKKWM